MAKLSSFAAKGEAKCRMVSKMMRGNSTIEAYVGIRIGCRAGCGRDCAGRRETSGADVAGHVALPAGAGAVSEAASPDRGGAGDADRVLAAAGVGDGSQFQGDWRARW